MGRWRHTCWLAFLAVRLPAPHIRLRDEVLRPVTAVVTRQDSVEYWAIKPAGRLARFRPRRRLPREAAQKELRRRAKPGGRVTAYSDDGPTGPLCPP